MIIRTSTFGQNKTQLNQLMAQQNKLLELQQQADSKKKVNTLTDNPNEISTVMNLNQQLSQISSYLNNIKVAQNQLSIMDTTFEEINKKLERINDLGVQLMNGTGSADTVSASKKEIDQLIESVMDTANKEYNGEYLFSGAKVNKTPFTMVKDANGVITSITYNGTKAGVDGAEKKYEVSNGVKVAVNATGDSIFGSFDAANPANSTGLFGALGELSNTLGQYPANPAPGDMDAYNARLEAAMNGLQSSMKSVNAARTDFGSRSSRLTLTESSLTDLQLSTTSHKSSIVDLDMVEGLSNLLQQNYAYQSSMQTYIMLQQNSLMKYLS